MLLSGNRGTPFNKENAVYFVNFKLEEGAIKPKIRSDLDAGYDLYSTEFQTIRPQTSKYIHVGVSIEMPQNLFAYLTNTSTLGSKKIVCLSHIIDAGYRGDLGPILFNLDTWIPYQIAPGDKVAQIVFLPRISVTLLERGVLGAGNREEKCFREFQDFKESF
jgi:dUTP pyrophosphatase